MVLLLLLLLLLLVCLTVLMLLARMRRLPAEGALLGGREERLRLPVACGRLFMVVKGRAPIILRGCWWREGSSVEMRMGVLHLAAVGGMMLS